MNENFFLPFEGHFKALHNFGRSSWLILKSRGTNFLGKFLCQTSPWKSYSWFWYERHLLLQMKASVEWNTIKLFWSCETYIKRLKSIGDINCVSGTRRYTCHWRQLLRRILQFFTQCNSHFLIIWKTSK